MIDPNTHLVIVSSSVGAATSLGGLIAAETSSDIPTIIAGLVILLPVLAAQIIAIMNAKAIRKEVAEIKAKTQETLTQATVIVGHVNSEKTAAEGRESALTNENRLLREMLTEKTQQAALLAQASVRPPAQPAAAKPQVAENIAATAKNTEETAKNTERTERKVDDIKKSQ